MENVYYVLNEESDEVIEKTTDRRKALDKAGKVWGDDGHGTVAKSPV